MSKRFTDTDKYKKGFMRGLPGPYKLFWDYLYHDCNNAGIWYVDFEIAQIYLGKDMVIEKGKALEFFNSGKARVIEFDGGRKWFIKPFIEFQYDCSLESLNPLNNAHKSVLNILKKEGFLGTPAKAPHEPLPSPSRAPSKPLTSPFQAPMDKDKDTAAAVVSSLRDEEEPTCQPGQKSAGPTADDLATLWNQESHRNLPRVTAMPDARKRTCNARLKDYPDKKFWDDFILRVNRSPLLRGETGSWKASFDWVLKESNFTKILEGNYDVKPARLSAA